jgi:aspartyl-tRNA(Asn)/glutamyl-tRNA(Gln) amidotransferase subunit C
VQQIPYKLLKVGAILDKASKIDRATMEHICALAKLNLTEKEMDSYAKELSDVLEAFKVLDGIDTKSDEPAFHPIEIKDRLRDDEVKTTKWDPLGNAKATEGRYFKGPKIV